MIYFYHVMGGKASFFSVPSLCHEQQRHYIMKCPLGDADARPVFRSAATRRRFGSPRLFAANLCAGDESPAVKSGTEFPHSESDATDQSTRVGWPT